MFRLTTEMKTDRQQQCLCEREKERGGKRGKRETERERERERQRRLFR